MGIVYEAEQLSLGRRVALKVLPRHAVGSSAVERFRREACAAAKLHHTNIVPVFEVGQDAEVSYYAMQLMQGCGLDQVIAELQRIRDVAGSPSVAGTSTGLQAADAPLGRRRTARDILATRAGWPYPSWPAGSRQQVVKQPIPKLAPRPAQSVIGEDSATPSDTPSSEPKPAGSRQSARRAHP